MPDKKQKLIGVIDQGTSSSRFIVFSASAGKIVARHQIEIEREHPHSGWVQQSATDIYESALKCINKVAKTLSSENLSNKDVFAIGITNQRETTIAWDSKTGEPLCPAIVWSDSRTSEIVEYFIRKSSNNNKLIFQEQTGLSLHSYFSAMKIRWMLENIPAVKSAYKKKCLKVGTVDSWLIYKLTGGSRGGKHLTDVTNASRTLLFNIIRNKWDKKICAYFNIDPEILPTVISSAEIYGTIEDPDCRMKGVALGGILGDQQAALVGQTWDPNPDPFSPRPHVKVTYGTGAFFLWDIGKKPVFSKHGILTTIAYQMGPEEPLTYALEGAIAYSGATMDWLKKSLKLFKDFQEADKLAAKALVKMHGIAKTTTGDESQISLKSIDSCYLVPAFTGLFCPYWREDARGLIMGFDENCTNGDIIAAGIRSSAYQTEEVLQAACQACDSKKNIRNKPRVITVDGGLTNSHILMQSLADITGSVIVRPNKSEVMTALGAAVAACIAVGLKVNKLLSIREHEPENEGENLFHPIVDEKTRKIWLNGWKNAVDRSLDWKKS